MYVTFETPEELQRGFRVMGLNKTLNECAFFLSRGDFTVSVNIPELAANPAVVEAAILNGLTDMLGIVQVDEADEEDMPLFVRKDVFDFLFEGLEEDFGL